jgi:hypothetical protein
MDMTKKFENQEREMNEQYQQMKDRLETEQDKVSDLE